MRDILKRGIFASKLWGGHTFPKGAGGTTVVTLRGVWKILVLVCDGQFLAKSIFAGRL